MPEYVIVKHVWGVLRLMEDALPVESLLHSRTFECDLRAGIVLIHVLENIVVDVMTPLAYTLVGVTDYAVFEMVKTRIDSPCTTAGAGVRTIYDYMINGL